MSSEGQSPSKAAHGLKGLNEETYRSWTPLLLSALARLARSGYRVDPANGLDIVHDFYLEALPGLLDRYDAARARFSTYLYGAFLRFARPRIVATLRSASVSADLELLGAQTSPSESRLLEETVERAFGNLPRPSRETLGVRILEGLSERKAAERLKVSRYVIRQRTAEALGRLAVAMGQDERIPSDVRPLALRLWRDGRSLMEVAGEFGLRRHQALALYREMLAGIASALGRDSDLLRKESTTMTDTLCAVWTQLLADPSNEAHRAAARDVLPALMEHVDDCKTCLQASASVKDPEQVFEALGDAPTELSDDDLAMLDRLDAAWDSNEQDIEAAVTDVLLPALPPDLSDLTELGEELTPLKAFLAMNAVDQLIYGHAPESESPSSGVTLSATGVTVGDTVVASRDAVVEEIGRHASTSSETANRLFDWMRQVATFRPRVFLHFIANGGREGQLALRLDEPRLQHDLFERWKPELPRQQSAEFEIMLALREIQSYSRQLEPALEAMAAAEPDEQARAALKKQAEDNRAEADEIENTLRKMHHVGRRIDALAMTRSRELRKGWLYKRLQRKGIGTGAPQDLHKILDTGLKKAKTHAQQTGKLLDAMKFEEH